MPPGRAPAPPPNARPPVPAGPGSARARSVAHIGRRASHRVPSLRQPALTGPEAATGMGGETGG